VLLMDEPVSSLDPKSAAVIEELIGELAERYAIVLVTAPIQRLVGWSRSMGRAIPETSRSSMFNTPQRS
jgi:ABC-type phosphate transport system ATPase subunit